MGDVLLFLVLLVVQTVISGSLLWVGLAVTGESGDIRALFLASFISSFFKIIPYLGGLIGFFALLALLSKWTTVDMWPGGVLVVVIANFLGAFLSMMLMASIG